MADRVTALDIAVLVMDELTRAQEKFRPFQSAHEGWAVMHEEMEELWAEVKSNQATPGRDERMRKEAIQIATVAFRFLIDHPGFTA